MKRSYFGFGVLIIFTLLLAACGTQAEAPAEMIQFSLPMGYIADPQFAPLYVAIEKGYMAEEGFELEFDYSFETDGVALVGAGEVPFAMVSGDVVLQARAEDIPIVYVMEWWQRYPIAVVSKAEAEIHEPADLVGRRIGIPGLFGASYVGMTGLLNANNLQGGDVQLDEIGFNQVESLVTDQVDAAVVYANNEPIQLEAVGEEINVIYVSDYADMVATGIVTSEQFAAENPGRVQGFVRAFVRGLRDTLDNPDEAFEISKNYVEGLDEERRPVLDASIEMWAAPRLGETDPASWKLTQDTLISMGFLDGPLDDLDAAYTNEFLPEPSN